MNKVTSKGSMFLRDYLGVIEPTDKLPPDDLHPVLMGLFGEVGSIMATVKKHIREEAAYTGYRQAVEEEFGDALWYFTACAGVLTLALTPFFPKQPIKTDTARSSPQAISWMGQFLISRRPVHCPLLTRRS